MAKRQPSLKAWLSNIPSKTARISDESESDNYEYSEMDYEYCPLFGTMPLITHARVKI